ncbi:MAG: bifunctional oligoribonuclease/PAP phosphatase NrnA [candidate division NC10 bacterium]|nr:bifunctional oligoribonuclease/PAP phosphatase NrnA [candidate division NC10 bacterium]
MTDLEGVIAALRAAPSVAVLAHVNPEGDAIGSLLGAVLALRAAGKAAHGYLADSLPPNLRQLPGAGELRRQVPIGPPYPCYLVLDTADLARTGGLLRSRPAASVVVNVDHHPDNSRFGDANWVEPTASSAGEMVLRLLETAGFPLPPPAAANLYAAILTDTGSFRHGNTSPAALRAAARLVEAGADPAVMAEGLFGQRQLREWRLLAAALATLEVSADGRAAWIEVTAEAQERAGAGLEDTEEIVDYPRTLAGVLVAVAFKEVGPGEVRVSFRSRGTLDVRAVATSLGGGGHRNAAACTLWTDLGAAKAAVLPAVMRLLATSLEGRED